MTDEELLEILFEARQTTNGIKVETNAPESLRARLYKLKKTEELFSNLSFVISPERPTQELWVVQKTRT